MHGINNAHPGEKEREMATTEEKAARLLELAQIEEMVDRTESRGWLS